MNAYNGNTPIKGIQLNDQQRAAVLRVEGATLLLAVPGSGKTTVIICRLGYMIGERGIAPDQILTLTFSRAGARDLGRRYRYFFGGEGEAPRFSTIHSFSLSVIRAYERMYDRHAFDLLENPGEVLRTLFLGLFKTYPSDNDIADITSAITYAKNMLLDEAAIEEMRVGDLDFPKIFKAYEAHKRKHHLMDFDDMLKYAWLLLKRDERLLAHFTRRYSYINIDEAQDTSKVQFEIIHLLAKASGNLFMVGDEDQSIYGFRGAYPKGLLSFKETYPQGEILLMETNHRSTGILVRAANAFITLNKERYVKNMITHNPGGMPPAHNYVKTLADQYRFILASVRQEGKELAILYRNNESAIPLVDLFEREGVAYQLKEHNPLFFTHFVVRDIVAFLRLAQDMTDFEVFKQIYYKMNCGISKVNMDKAERAHRPGDTVFRTLYTASGMAEWLVDKLKMQEAAFGRLKKMPIAQGVDYIYHYMGYCQHLDYRIDHGYREEQLMQKLDILKTLSARAQDSEDFLNRLEDLAAILREPKKGTREGVTLSTIHSSKGLEFEKVYIIDCVDGEFPSRAALEENEEGQRLLNEEIRLFYVGVTRAKKELEFVSVGQKGRPNPQRPVSRFVDYYMGNRQKQKKPSPVVRPKPKTVVGQMSVPQNLKKQPNHKKVGNAQNWAVGTELTHRRFGVGTVIAVDGTIATIRFTTGDVKKLNLDVCLGNGIIRLQSLDT